MAKLIGMSFGLWSRGMVRLNKARVAARKKAWEDGAWVREAAIAHANKRAARQSTALAAE
jgi:ring-1,2-phenylacetyl-CoA epoxidase subunit PaaA